MDCGALCFWFDASPLWSLLLALGERGRGEKGKLAMLLGNSGEVTLIVKHVMNVRKRQPWINFPIYLRTPFLTPGSVKTASQLQNTNQGEPTAAREEPNIKYSPLEVIRLPFSSDTLLLPRHSSNLNLGPTLPQDFCAPVGLLAPAAEQTTHPWEWDLKTWLLTKLSLVTWPEQEVHQLDTKRAELKTTRFCSDFRLLNNKGTLLISVCING